MSMTAEGRYSRALVLLLSLSLAAAPGCGDNAPDDNWPTPEEQHLASIEAELQAQVSAGLESQLPPPMSRERRDLVELTHYRRRIADDMRQSVDSAVAPLVMAAAIFAVNGPVDLMLAVVPVHKLGNAFDFAKEGLRLRRGSRRSRKLLELHRELDAVLPAYGKEFLHLAGALKTADRKALKIIHKRVAQDKVIHTLMRRHLDGAADVRWIAGKLEQGKLDRTFVRRYTFDADIIEDITDHHAHVSWRTLQAVVESETVTDPARQVLRNKLAGLMGERVARARIASSAYARRVLKLKADDKIVSARGLGYSGGSLDVAVYSEKGLAAFAEVKNWGTSSWVSNWREVVAQLSKHDRGIRETLAAGDETRTVAAKILVVTRQGYYGWEKTKRKVFREQVTGLGWRLDFIDGSRIKDFRSILDDLR